MCYAPPPRMDALRSQGLKSAIYGTLVVAMGVVFVVQFKSGGQGQKGMKVDCVAEVRGECLSSRDYRATLALIAPRAEDAQMKQLQLRKRTLDGLVERALLAQDGERLGVSISDDDLNTALTSGHFLVSLGVETPPMVTQYSLRLPIERPMRVVDVKANGQFDKKAYTKALRLYVGRGEAEFREMQRSEHLAARMRDLIKARVRLSEAEVFEAYERDKTKMTFKHVKLDRSWVARFLVPKTKEAIDAFAAEHKAQIDSAWESRKKQYLPECRRARHVLAKAGLTATDDEKIAARKKIESAIERVKKGERFEDVARELSEDSSAPDGGELGCVAKGKMVKPFEEATFALAKAGDLSGVVETEYGFHVVQLDGIYKDAEAETQGRIDITRELMMNIEAETRAAELGKKLLEAVHSGKSLDDALAAVLAAQKFETPKAPEAKGDKKDDKKKDDKKGKEGDKKGKEGDKKEEKEEPKKPTGPLDDPDAPRVVLASDLTAEGTSPLPDTEAMNVAFSLKKPGEAPSDLVKLPNGYAVLQLVERKTPGKQEFDGERERYSRALLSAKQQDALIAYVNRLREVAKAEIKVNQAYLADKAPEEAPE